MNEFIYFLKPQNFSGPIKIGCSFLPESRLTTMMKWSPFPLEIMTTTPGSFVLETALHHHFADVHLHAEWFQPVDRLVHGIEQLRQGASLEQAFDLSVKNGSIRSYRTRSKLFMTPEWKLRRSYRSRLMWAERRFQARVPDDVDQILHFSKTQLPLSDADRARLDDVLGDPQKHLISWRAA